MLGKQERVCSPVWGEDAGYSLDLLKQGSLLKTDDGGRFAVHDQLRDMGRRMVQKRSPVSHAWMPEASLEMLRQLPSTIYFGSVHQAKVDLT